MWRNRWGEIDGFCVECVDFNLMIAELLRFIRKSIWVCVQPPLVSFRSFFLSVRLKFLHPQHSATMTGRYTVYLLKNKDTNHQSWGKAIVGFPLYFNQHLFFLASKKFPSLNPPPENTLAAFCNLVNHWALPTGSLPKTEKLSNWSFNTTHKTDSPQTVSPSFPPNKKAVVNMMTSWWFQPFWKIWVKLEIFPK